MPKTVERGEISRRDFLISMGKGAAALGLAKALREVPMVYGETGDAEGARLKPGTPLDIDRVFAVETDFMEAPRFPKVLMQSNLFRKGGMIAEGISERGRGRIRVTKVIDGKRKGEIPLEIEGVDDSKEFLVQQAVLGNNQTTKQMAWNPAGRKEFLFVYRVERGSEEVYHAVYDEASGKFKARETGVRDEIIKKFDRTDERKVSIRLSDWYDDGKTQRILCLERDEGILEYNPETKTLQKVVIPTNVINSTTLRMAYNPANPRQIAGLGEGETLRGRTRLFLHDLDTGKTWVSEDRREGSDRDLEWSPDGSKIASGGTVRGIDTGEGIVTVVKPKKGGGVEGGRTVENKRFFGGNVNLGCTRGLEFLDDTHLVYVVQETEGKYALAIADTETGKKRVIPGTEGKAFQGSISTAGDGTIAVKLGTGGVRLFELRQK